MTASVGHDLGGLADLRRRLHRLPEVGLHLPRTQAVVLDELAGLPLEVTQGGELSFVVAVLRGGRPGPVVLLRSDMDALPITEQTGEPFAADGEAMHACGHDLHMAALIGAARLLSADRDRLAGTVLLVFQPGEEGHGGARRMIEAGLLDIAGERPAAAYALHVIADLPHGVAFTRTGPVMAAYTVLDIEVTGRGAHGGRPHEGADPVPVAAETVTALHTYLDRRFDPFDPVVLTVGEISAGAAPNVVAERVTMRAGVRTFSERATDRVACELPRLVQGIATAHGITARVEVTEVMGPTVNNAAAAEVWAGTARDLLGEDRYVELADPRAGSEDFSEVLRHVPGAFGYLGAARPGAVSPVGNHSPRAVFDDAVLPDAARLLAGLARHHLDAGNDPDRPERQS